MKCFESSRQERRCQGRARRRKSTPMSDVKLESGREELERWAVVCLFLNSEGKKIEIAQLAKHSLTPVPFEFHLPVWLFSLAHSLSCVGMVWALEGDSND